MHQLHIAVTHADADFVNSINTIDSGSPGPNGNQRVHVRCAMEQGAKAHLEVFAVDRQHWEQQKELGEGEGHGVIHAQQPDRQGPVHHVSHGDIEEGDREQGREDQPLLHGFVLRLCRADFRFCFFAALARGLWGHTIPGVLHRSHDGGSIQNALVIRDCHAVLQQVYGHLRNTGQLCHTLFYSGGASGAGHTGDIELFLLHVHPFFPVCKVLIFRFSAIGAAATQPPHKDLL